ncbi:MAG: hypothetical protein ACOCRK_03530 [bacterium]
MKELVDQLNKIIDVFPEYNINEDKEFIQLTYQFEKESLDKILEIEFINLFSVIGNFISVYLKSIDKDGINFDFNGESYNEHDLKTHLEGIQNNYSDIIIELEINIDKTKIIEQNKDLWPAKEVYLFFYAKYLQEWLNQIEYYNLNSFFSDNNLIIILDGDTFITNDYFKIIGGKYLNDFKFEKISSSDNLNTRIKNHKQFCYTNVLSNLPPDIFYFESNVEKQESNNQWIISYFNMIVLKSVLIFLANRIDEPSKEAIIDGYKKIKINIDNIDNITIENNKVAQVMELYNWVYDEKVSDRMEIIRNVLTRNLCSEFHGNIFELFLKRIEEIYSSARSIFKTYIQDKMKVYFEERSKIEVQVYDRLKDLDTEIKQLMRLFNNNIFGVIGAIITVLAGYLTQNVPLLFIRFIIFASAGFILINTTYYSYYSYKSKNHITATYNSFIEHCKSILFEKEVNRIIGEINGKKSVMTEKKKMFCIYFWANVIISVILGGLLIYTAYNIELVIEVFNFHELFNI